MIINDSNSAGAPHRLVIQLPYNQILKGFVHSSSSSGYGYYVESDAMHFVMLQGI